MYSYVDSFLLTKTTIRQLRIVDDCSARPYLHRSCKQLLRNDGTSTLTATGTTGGVFSGPGVIGNTFDPSLAGAGTHTIKYVVSAQQGAAVAPVPDSLEITVTVSAATTYFVDNDNDGYGDLNDSGTAYCTNPEMDLQPTTMLR